MANREIVEFDQNLYLPPELAGARYEEIFQLPDPEEEYDELEFDVDGGLDEGGDEEDVLETPSWANILSQVVRTAPDGRQVVDVVLDIEDVYGSIKYEVRITKT